MTTTVLRASLAAGALSMAALGGAAHAAAAEPTVAEPTNGNVFPGAKDNFDPVYNVCRGTDPRCYNPWVDNRQNKVLIYSRTAGPRHANLGSALAAGLNPPLGANNVAQKALIAWMAEQGVAADWTEDVTRLSGLNQYKAVIFMSPTRDTMQKHGTAVSVTSAVNTTTNAHLDAGKTALRQYIRAGGGFVGIHNAFGTEYNWPWYEGLLGNANYYDHGANQDGVSVIVNKDSSTEGLPTRWGYKDEWYNLVPFPTRVKFLATVDESTLATRRTTHPGHGSFHPTTWCQYYDGGRSWVTTLGHDGQAFVDGSTFPGQAQFKSLVVNGILSAMGNKPFCQ
ncbi:MAG: ThuA domain-containing protein [Pseudomonadota bacterium]